jgi:hypothetical protein
MYDGPEKECKQILYFRLPAALPQFVTRVVNIVLHFTMPSWFVTGVDVRKVCRIGRVGEQSSTFAPHHPCSFFISYECNSGNIIF